MSRRRHGRGINGWLVLDKPVGLTSNAALMRVRRALNAAKAGHGGALDPLASGILPIALGEATKTVPFIMEGLKSYDFTVRWGEARDSDDAQGELLETSDVRPEMADIQTHLAAFIGMIEQIPPRVSAIKVNGRRAYQLARTGQKVTLTSRRVMIRHIALIGCPDPDHAQFHLICGKGCYVRSLARDLAQKLGTLGHVTALRRTRVGPFDTAGAISLDSFERLGQRGEEQLLPVGAVLSDVPSVSVTSAQAALLRNGQGLAVFRLAAYRSRQSGFGEAVPEHRPENRVTQNDTGRKDTRRNDPGQNDIDENGTDYGNMHAIQGLKSDVSPKSQYFSDSTICDSDNRPRSGSPDDHVFCDHRNKMFHDDQSGGNLVKDRLYGDVEVENVRVVTCQGHLVALAHVTQGVLRPVRVFHVGPMQ